ncbi:hypothetical protein [Candidatus Nitrosacidococcus sp. I8]|uniref:hypothetical protein n=1 Tax=Candidatus Nitrosacidococcus sp. I8 TaxID=2942908 RepID=UPI0022278E36|nr:hypothetical protein [Candidatus Nitrosacidococcus sp. I8]CAH9018345.1 hypothetical protein NURINAE_00872 [Candidatus Nitrosacidococcus sp. I8]
MNHLYTKYRQLRYEMRCIISLFPSIFLPIAKLRGYSLDRAQPVSLGTDLVIESFPRSGNTFTYFAIQSSQPVPLQIAHHFHAPAQIIAAVRWKKPALVIIRNPIDSICSLIQRDVQGENLITPNQAFRNWIRFYESIFEYRYGFVVATFNQITTDLGQVVQRINNQFNTQFYQFQHNKEGVESCFQKIEEHEKRIFGEDIENSTAKPTPKRVDNKGYILQKLNSNNYNEIHMRANNVYAQYASLAGDPSYE